MDVMATMPDDELIARFRSLDDDRMYMTERGFDARSWEEEIAYVRRELQIRRSRHETHQKHAQHLEREFFDSESSLPAADLDNSAFLKFIGEWN